MPASPGGAGLPRSHLVREKRRERKGGQQRKERWCLAGAVREYGQEAAQEACAHCTKTVVAFAAALPFPTATVVMVVVQHEPNRTLA